MNRNNPLRRVWRKRNNLRRKVFEPQTYRMFRQLGTYSTIEDVARLAFSRGQGVRFELIEHKE